METQDLMICKSSHFLHIAKFLFKNFFGVLILHNIQSCHILYYCLLYTCLIWNYISLILYVHSDIYIAFFENCCFILYWVFFAICYFSVVSIVKTQHFHSSQWWYWLQPKLMWDVWRLQNPRSSTAFRFRTAWVYASSSLMFSSFPMLQTISKVDLLRPLPAFCLLAI